MNINKLREFQNMNVNREPQDQSKSFKGECKNCANKRRPASAYCQKCSDNHKK